MTDYDQLLGVIKAVEAIEHQVYLLNRKKTRILRETIVCGLNRRAIKRLVQMRRKGAVPDEHVPSVYEGLVDEIDSTD